MIRQLCLLSLGPLLLASGGCEQKPCWEAPCAWPGEAVADAVNLTVVEGSGQNDFYEDLSGASFDTTQNQLWVCRNGPGDESKVWILSPEADDFTVAEVDGERAEWTDFGDLEGLTFDPQNALGIFGMVEGKETIRQWQLDPQSASGDTVAKWDLSADLPLSGSLGAEGIAFISDQDLEAGGFTDPSGQSRLSSRGLGGLLFIGHQNGGDIYVVDLEPDGDDYDLVGIYPTSYGETAALEFDSMTGNLYIWHGGDHQVLEITNLKTQANGAFTIKALYESPDRQANFEGLAIDNSRCPGNRSHLFLTEDDGADHALLWFKTLPCPL